MEVFQNMWFTPVKEKPSVDKDVMIRKVMNITDVVAASEDMGLEWFEQLLVSVSTTPIFRLSTRSSVAIKSCLNNRLRSKECRISIEAFVFHRKCDRCDFCIIQATHMKCYDIS